MFRLGCVMFVVSVRVSGRASVSVSGSVIVNDLSALVCVCMLQFMLV